MIPEIGNFAVMLALCLALVQGTLPIIGSLRGNRHWMAIARPAAYGQFAFITLAFLCLVYSFVSNDFSVAYVASHSNSTLPVHYRVSAAWGGHEGSLLLWTQMLVLWTLGVALFSRQLPQETVARVLGVVGLYASNCHSSSGIINFERSAFLDCATSKLRQTAKFAKPLADRLGWMKPIPGSPAR